MAGRLPHLAESCGKLQARCGEPKAIGGVCGFVARRSRLKSVSTEALMLHDATNCPRHREIRTPVQPLAAHSKSKLGQAPRRSARNPAPREVLNFGLRFTQSSNINSADESCGKLKARRFAIFSCGKTRFFRGGDMAEAFVTSCGNNSYYLALLARTDRQFLLLTMHKCRRNGPNRSSFLGRRDQPADIGPHWTS